MSSALALSPCGSTERPEDEARRRTLDDLISELWAGLLDRQTVTCPACGGRMDPDYSASSRPIGGRCLRCGSTLR